MNSKQIGIIFKRLCLFVEVIRWRMPDIFDGCSAEDLPSEVLISYLESPNELGWNPAIGSLEGFLIGVLKHKMLDHLRRQEHAAGSLDDPDYFKRIDKVSSNQLQPTQEHQKMESTDLRTRLLHVANGDPKLKELIEAAQDIPDAPNTNQQLADKLKTTPSDIVNRKKRLVRKFPQNGDLL